MTVVDVNARENTRNPCGYYIYRVYDRINRRRTFVDDFEEGQGHGCWLLSLEQRKNIYDTWHPVRIYAFDGRVISEELNGRVRP